MSLINSLPAVISEQNSKSVYVNLFTHKHMVLEFLSSASAISHDSCVTSFVDKDTFLSGLDNNSIQAFDYLAENHISSLYFLAVKKAKKKLAPLILAKDLYKLTLRNNSQLVLILPDSILSHYSDDDIGVFLRKINALARKKSLKVNICIFGHLATSVLKPKLLTINQFIAGLTTMAVLDNSRYSYLIDFWSNTHGVKSEQEFIVTFGDQGHLQATQYEHFLSTDVKEDKADSERVYMSKDAVMEGAVVAKSIHLADNNQHLIDMLDSPRASTLIFSCTSQGEVHQLALDCYRLRTQAGRQLKIIIRETKQCLRHADEQFFLRAGVNLICPAQVPHTRFMTQVEAIQGQILTRTLPRTLDSLLKYDVKFGSKGYLNHQDFIQYCTDIITNSTHANVNYCLIRLKLLPGMSAGECLRLCHIRRDGDVVTAGNTALYVLFSMIRPSDIDMALSNIFEFPVRDLFHSVRIFDTQIDVEAELKYIVQDKVEVAKEISSLATEQKLFSPAAHTIAEEPELFAVKQAIRLKG
ncbi:hypothetical protein VISI1226_01925 [Vibrio sinaloensis DSM 21326]|uniref:Cellulose biosynthesis protein BcsE n=1 Tax=Vibrio sinaloensis DSM 21326 TaxID=945550 RepID=E8M1W2_PHOS4|nr:cellulose biosynthesis protein BcsE [Vibrio sinaloensis]EGA71976.1 hypothetical protein VISI1226_01925 [Vibrio sinaloensis DSM 21326]